MTPKKTKNPDCAKLNEIYTRGNFYAARNVAKSLLAKEDAHEDTRTCAKSILSMTRIDNLGLLAGLCCLIFTSIVAFVVGA